MGIQGTFQKDAHTLCLFRDSVAIKIKEDVVSLSTVLNAGNNVFFYFYFIFLPFCILYLKIERWWTHLACHSIIVTG